MFRIEYHENWSRSLSFKIIHFENWVKIFSTNERIADVWVWRQVIPTEVYEEAKNS